MQLDNIDFLLIKDDHNRWKGNGPQQKKKKMFRTITSLIFGGKKETCEEVQPGEVLEEDWLLVSHQGMFSRLRNPSYVHYWSAYNNEHSSFILSVITE